MPWPRLGPSRRRPPRRRPSHRRGRHRWPRLRRPTRLRWRRCSSASPARSQQGPRRVLQRRRRCPKVSSAWRSAARPSQSTGPLAKASRSCRGAPQGRRRMQSGAGMTMIFGALLRRVAGPHPGDQPARRHIYCAGPGGDAAVRRRLGRGPGGDRGRDAACRRGGRCLRPVLIRRGGTVALEAHSNHLCDRCRRFRNTRDNRF